ncbi:MAG: hypothetical protein HQ582_26350 [Planctomycetes bacterium]|nr:hypothetical protein [Planctomycetota bacterium]
MNEPESELKKALAENGVFDPGRARESREKVVSTFKAAMRKVERYLWVYMCLCSWLFVFALFHFFHSATTKGMIFYGLLLLMFFETTVLMKLWYWIVNNKLTVIKEVKQLQLGGAPGDDADHASWPSDRPKGATGSLSPWERRVWWVVLFVGVWFVAWVKIEGDGFWHPETLATLTSDGCVTLSADGSGSSVTERSFVYQGIENQESFQDRAPKEAELRFTDSHGKKLPFTMSPENGETRYEVTLNRTVWPGQRSSYTRVEERPGWAEEEGGIWTCSKKCVHGYGTNEFSETVVLPAGAEIVSVNPWPVGSFTLTERPTVRFQATRGRNESFEYTIQYRLPQKTDVDPEAGSSGGQ